MIRSLFFRSRFLTLFLSLCLALPAPAFALRPISTRENAGLEEKLMLALRGPRQQPLSRTVGLEENLQSLVQKVFGQANAVTLGGFGTIGRERIDAKGNIRTSVGPSEKQGDSSLGIAGSFMDDSLDGEAYHTLKKDGQVVGYGWDFSKRAPRSLYYGTGWRITVRLSSPSPQVQQYRFRVLLKDGDSRVEIPGVSDWQEPVLTGGAYQVSVPIHFDKVAEKVLGRKLQTKGGTLPWYKSVANKLVRTDFIQDERELLGVDETLINREFIVEVRPAAPAAPTEAAAPMEPAPPVAPPVEPQVTQPTGSQVEAGSSPAAVPASLESLHLSDALSGALQKLGIADVPTLIQQDRDDLLVRLLRRKQKGVNKKTFDDMERELAQHGLRLGQPESSAPAPAPAASVVPSAKVVSVPAAPVAPVGPPAPAPEVAVPPPVIPAATAAPAAPVAKRTRVLTPSRLVVAGTVAGALLLGGAAVITNSLREKPADGAAQPQVVLASKPAENLPKQGVSPVESQREGKQQPIAQAGEKNPVASGLASPAKRNSGTPKEDAASQGNQQNVQAQTQQKTAQASPVGKKPDFNAPLSPIEEMQWEYLKRLIDEERDPRVSDEYVQRFRELLNEPRERGYENIRRFLRDVKRIHQQETNPNPVVGDIVNPPPGGIPVFPKPAIRQPARPGTGRNPGDMGYQQPSSVRPVRNQNQTARQQTPVLQNQRPQPFFQEQNGQNGMPIDALNSPESVQFLLWAAQHPRIAQPFLDPKTGMPTGAYVVDPNEISRIIPEEFIPKELIPLLPDPPAPGEAPSTDRIVLIPSAGPQLPPTVQTGQEIAAGVDKNTGDKISAVVTTNPVTGEPVGGVAIVSGSGSAPSDQTKPPAPSTTPPVINTPPVETPPIIPPPPSSGGTGTPPRGGAGTGAPNRGGATAPRPGGLEEKSSGAGLETRLDVPAMVGRSSVRVVIAPSALQQMAGLEQAIGILQASGLQDRVIILPRADLGETAVREQLAQVAVQLLSVPDVAVKGYAADGDPVMTGLEEMLGKARLPIERGRLAGLRFMVRQILQDLGAPSNDATDQAVNNVLSAVGLEEAA